jgi:hypothetical protein
VSWLVAETGSTTPRQRAVVLAAGLVPDLDALSLIGGLEAYQAWHHTLLHNGLAAVASSVALGIAAGPPGRLAVLGRALAAFHLHLAGDLVGSAGPDGSVWAIPYWEPFSATVLAWDGQWGLASWQNTAFTVVLLAASAVLGARRGRTLLEPLSARADAAVVEVLRRRLRWAAPKPVAGTSN